MQNIDFFLLTIYIYGNAKMSDKKKKKSKEDEQTSAELSLAHCCLQANCQPVQTSYIERIKFLLLAR